MPPTAMENTVVDPMMVDGGSPIDRQLRRHDTVMEYTGEIRKKSISRILQIVESVNPEDFTSLKAGTQQALGSLMSTLNSLLSGQETASSGRVRLETARKTAENDEAVGKLAVEMLKTISNRTFVPTPSIPDEAGLAARVKSSVPDIADHELLDTDDRSDSEIEDVISNIDP